MGKKTQGEDGNIMKESSEQTISLNRDEAKQAFLNTHKLQKAERQPIPSDCSFRSYERLLLKEGESRILMDAPPEKEDVEPFISMSSYLCDHGFSAPKVYAQDVEEGFVLLEDFGDDSYTRVLDKVANVNQQRELELYQKAVDVILALQKLPVLANVPTYTDQLLLEEVELFTEWYLPVLKNGDLSEEQAQEFLHIWKQLLPYTYILENTLVLRDYHADNLMVLSERSGIQEVGLLDFQDAVIGSPAYDMLSLLEDARRDVSPHVASAMINYYLDQMPHINRKDFLASYAILGAQRNCKIMGIFARKMARDHNSRYLGNLSRVWNHIQNNLKHPLLEPLQLWMEKAVEG